MYRERRGATTGANVTRKMGPEVGGKKDQGGGRGTHHENKWSFNKPRNWSPSPTYHEMRGQRRMRDDRLRPLPLQLPVWGKHGNTPPPRTAATVSSNRTGSWDTSPQWDRHPRTLPPPLPFALPSGCGAAGEGGHFDRKVSGWCRSGGAKIRGVDVPAAEDRQSPVVSHRNTGGRGRDGGTGHKDWKGHNPNGREHLPWEAWTTGGG